MFQFEWRGEQLELLAEKALYWPARRTLLLADPHFGKAATFRHAGIPIPHGTTAADLARLDCVLKKTGAERLVVLGDFFHAPTGRAEGTMRTLANWRTAHRQLAIVLVIGNHDRRAGVPPAEWNVECAHEPLVEPPFVYAHEPQKHAGGYVLAGHLHPSLTLHDVSGPALRSPCYWFAAHCGILPAFGSFTGTHSIDPQAKDHVFVVGPDAVLRVPLCAPARPKRARALRQK